MNAWQVNEFRRELLDKCPDCAGIEVTHIGRFRVKVTAVGPDAYQSMIFLNLDDDDEPAQWANRAAKQLHIHHVVEAS